jgi:hypothetical protein
MKEIAKFYVNASICHDFGNMRQLLTRYPEGNLLNTCFSMELETNSSLYGELHSFLVSLGLKPRAPHAGDSVGEYGLTVMRYYDETDWDQAKYLQPFPKTTLGLSIQRSMKDRLLLRPAHARRTHLLAAANWAWLVVSDDMRQKLEQAGLQRLKFLEVQFPKTLPVDAGTLWELTSDLRLPRMSPRCKFVTELGGKQVPQWEPNTVLVEGDGMIGDIHPEFHYQESVVRSVEPFDLALTFEGWGGGEGDPKLVASQRFYQFCRAQQIKMSWMPVRIDPD